MLFIKVSFYIRWEQNYISKLHQHDDAHFNVLIQRKHRKNKQKYFQKKHCKSLVNGCFWKSWPISSDLVDLSLIKQVIRPHFWKHLCFLWKHVMCFLLRKSLSPHTGTCTKKDPTTGVFPYVSLDIYLHHFISTQPYFSNSLQKHMVRKLKAFNYGSYWSRLLQIYKVFCKTSPLNF